MDLALEQSKGGFYLTILLTSNVDNKILFSSYLIFLSFFLFLRLGTHFMTHHFEGRVPHDIIFKGRGRGLFWSPTPLFNRGSMIPLKVETLMTLAVRVPCYQRVRLGRLGVLPSYRQEVLH